MTDDEILAYAKAHPLLPYTHIARRLGEPMRRVYRVMHPKRTGIMSAASPDPTPEYIAAAMQAIQESHRQLMRKDRHGESAGTEAEPRSD